jgi:hypothetical protein
LASLLAGPVDFRATIVPREGWGADESLRFGPDGSELWLRAYVVARLAAVHHTATTNDYGDGAAEVRAIYTYHAQTLGWGDIGYHLLIDASGRVYEGRRGRDVDPEGRFERDLASRDVVAGHAYGFNHGSVAVAMIGNFSERPLPAVMREQLVAALVYLCGRSGIDPLERADVPLVSDIWRDEVPRLAGHRDCTPTECPGELLYAELGAIRAAVAGELAQADRPRAGPVRLAQGRAPWPGRLDFSWSGPVGAEYSLLLEGWRRLPGHDDLVLVSGYGENDLPVWGDWGPATSFSYEVPVAGHGHYTLHVRARLGGSGVSTSWSRFAALVEPQVVVDNVDSRLAGAETGEWTVGNQPHEFFGRDFVYSPAGTGERRFRWRLTAPGSGRYAVQACWPSLADFSRAASFGVYVEERLVSALQVDQTANGAIWQRLGEVELAAGQRCEVVLKAADDGTLVADAVRLLLLSEA